MASEEIVAAEEVSVVVTKAVAAEVSVVEVAGSGDEMTLDLQEADSEADAAAASATVALAAVEASTGPRTDLAHRRAKGDLVGTAARLVGAWVYPAGAASASSAKAPAGSTIGRRNGHATRPCFRVRVQVALW